MHICKKILKNIIYKANLFITKSLTAIITLGGLYEFDCLQ